MRFLTFFCIIFPVFFSIGDPVIATVDEVLRKSESNGYGFVFTRQRVTDTVHRMWDEGLEYDNTVKVLARLVAEEVSDKVRSGIKIRNDN